MKRRSVNDPAARTQQFSSNGFESSPALGQTALDAAKKEHNSQF